MMVEKNYSVRVEGAKYGVSFGSALAIVVSYNANHSIIWAIIHGLQELAIRRLFCYVPLMGTRGGCWNDISCTNELAC
jgi:hypothetical protein